MATLQNIKKTIHKNNDFTDFVKSMKICFLFCNKYIYK